jgi:hypothetical protein
MTVSLPRIIFSAISFYPTDVRLMVVQTHHFRTPTMVSQRVEIDPSISEALSCSYVSTVQSRSSKAVSSPIDDGTLDFLDDLQCTRRQEEEEETET